MKLKLVSLALATLTVLAACATTATPSGAGSAAGANAIQIGTTDKVSALDPAGSWDNGSANVENQVYPYLVGILPGAKTNEPQPLLGDSAKFTSPTEYTVTLKDGLTFANGHKLTASDVKFSFDRQLKIADPHGPSSMLASLKEVKTPNENTVVFVLKEPDQTFPQVLTTVASLIVDEEVFPADKILPDTEIVKAKPFGGQYTIADYQPGSLINFAPNAAYTGNLEPVKNDGVVMRVYADASNLRLDLENGTLDVGYRQLAATDIEALSKNENLKLEKGAGGEMRYITFNMDTMPFGAKTAQADPAKAKAVRAAIADLVDREALSRDVYKGTYTPLLSYLPKGFDGSKDTLAKAYGNGSGAPDAARAAKRLADAGVATPVTIALQYNPDHYGKNSGDEYAAIKTQLEKSGLFTVNLASTEWVQYSKERIADAYPVYQLGWFPDYVDPDNYLAPFFGTDTFVQNHYANKAVQEKVAAQRTEADRAKRAAIIDEIQAQVTADLPTLPLLQGQQVVVMKKDVSGFELGASYKLYYAPVAKGK
ncbi:peptide/nickel transport system substrate-binding protein [Arcanobacterium wilhelmae]|uniref:Peptide/nickel transport system substrate-binding protein n=1 Tax=Arcanobacterium wilhelmae TaxID=1803177 RepID=A0ABT9NCH8_9ACTO|nr:ABC transporter substrate-binding protein [Arcanobacterium wilhelmae]MDP9801195.1 peptide/nickel transport system substrate-binding protein [Arcanobacterium wilhelmae]WFN90547.1 ABC transporter substrate-binding protein [Arcanobacterium wilhelmae]